MPPRRTRWWHEIRAAPAGRRFYTYYQTREKRRQRGEAPAWNRPLRLIAALACLVIAIPLMILPGPAVLFYAIAGLLIAGESAWTARLFDRTEILARRLWSRLRKR